MTEFKDFAVTADYINALPEAERWFEISDKPYYFTEENPKEKNPEQLVFPVKLADGKSGKYYPNKTSARKVASLLRSTNMDEWVGKKFFWGNIVKMQAFGSMHTVLYVTDFYPAVKVV